jgi:sarcosine oxidase
VTSPSGTQDSVDVVVIGAGAVGAATARALALRGTSVALLEQFGLAEAGGSSRGGARIMVPGPFPDADYLERGKRALAEWQELELSTGIRFLDLRGVLLTSPDMIPLVDDFTRADIPVELLSRATIADRFGISDVDAETVFHHRGAGMIRADCARAALLRSAADAGVRAYENEPVLAIVPGSDDVTIETGRRTWRCTRAAICAGPWTNELLRPLGLELPLRVSSQAVAYFGTPADAERAPVLIEHGEGEPYSLPDPARGLKVALHRRGPVAKPSEPWEVADSADIDRLVEWAHARFPWVSGQPTHVEACLYTNTPDDRFILTREGPLAIASACNGQGFHLAPATGESLAELALS